jgi:hypothetical protein
VPAGAREAQFEHHWHVTRTTLRNSLTRRNGRDCGLETAAFITIMKRLSSVLRGTDCRMSSQLQHRRQSALHTYLNGWLVYQHEHRRNATLTEGRRNFLSQANVLLTSQVCVISTLLPVPNTSLYSHSITAALFNPIISSTAL